MSFPPTENFPLTAKETLTAFHKDHKEMHHYACERLKDAYEMKRTIDNFGKFHSFSPLSTCQEKVENLKTMIQELVDSNRIEVDSWRRVLNILPYDYQITRASGSPMLSVMDTPSPEGSPMLSIMDTPSPEVSLRYNIMETPSPTGSLVLLPPAPKKSKLDKTFFCTAKEVFDSNKEKLINDRIIKNCFD